MRLINIDMECRIHQIVKKRGEIGGFFQRINKEEGLMKHRILLVIFLFSQVMWAQDNSKEIWQPDEKDFFGIWEAVLEGTPPDTAKKEEPSKLIIFKDNA